MLEHEFGNRSKKLCNAGVLVEYFLVMLLSETILDK